MKKCIALLLCAALLAAACPALADAAPEFYDLPSDRYDPAVAQQALTIAELCYSLLPQQLMLAAMGYTKIGDYNMRRAADDGRHVVGYALFKKALENGRTAVILAVRGTAEGEWPLNMDLVPSGNYDLPYAENFYLAAQDIWDTHADFLAALVRPVFLVTGHSRGAAVANILGAYLSDRFGAENVYAYTFATPRTVRGERQDYPNIFNLINPTDLVTYLPFPEWGFGRYGVDLILPVESADGARRQRAMDAYNKRMDKLGEDMALRLPADVISAWTQAMTGLMPTVQSAYHLRHALLHSGEAAADEDAMTGWDLMEHLISALLSGDPQTVSDLLAPFRQADNDFAPAVAAIEALMTAGGASAVGSAHMPATYGAWMTVMDIQP